MLGTAIRSTLPLRTVREATSTGMMTLTLQQAQNRRAQALSRKTTDEGRNSPRDVTAEHWRPDSSGRQGDLPEKPRLQSHNWRKQMHRCGGRRARLHEGTLQARRKNKQGRHPKLSGQKAHAPGRLRVHATSRICPCAQENNGHPRGQTTASRSEPVLQRNTVGRRRRRSVATDDGCSCRHGGPVNVSPSLLPMAYALTTPKSVRHPGTAAPDQQTSL